MKHLLSTAVVSATLSLATPAFAEVIESTHGGFASTHSVVVAADRAEGEFLCHGVA